VVDPIGIGLLVDDTVVHRGGVVTLELAHHRRIDVAVQDAGDVIAIVDRDEAAAHGISVAMLEEDLLARVALLCLEIHGEGCPVESQTSQRDTVDGLVLGNLDGRRIIDNLGGIVHRLVRIVELDALDLGCGLDRDERSVRILDYEQGAGGFAVNYGAAAGRTMDADQGDILFQDESAPHRIAAFDGLQIERRTPAGSPVDGVLELHLVDAGRILRQHAEGLDRIGHGLFSVFGLDGHFDDFIDGVFDGFPDDFGTGYQRDEHQQQGDLRFHG
jgi:hypothetical protein